MESDFVLVTCGFASLLLVFLTWLIDIRKKQKWGYPFHVFGTNPLFILYSWPVC